MQQEDSQLKFRFFKNKTEKLTSYFENISFPGSGGVPVPDVISFFIRGLTKGSLNIRASAIAFNFMLALGPALIFLLSTIPYLPIKDFRNEMLEIFNEIIPTNSYIALEALIDQLFIKSSGMQVFGFLVAFFFAQKGINGMIEAFNVTYHTIETRPWLQRRVIAILLGFILFILVTVALSLLFFNKVFINKLVENDFIKADFTYFLFLTGRWFIITILTFISISFFYYLGPSRKTCWRFFTAGSILATFLTILASVGFSYFVNHFAQFNRFFGSIGALVALMLWMNFNALTLLIGFELNASIKNARISFDSNLETKTSNNK
ncbi:MAG: YihY/virulence factor BrkB family protein [Bacteroidales bacterium]